MPDVPTEAHKLAAFAAPAARLQDEIKARPGTEPACLSELISAARGLKPDASAASKGLHGPHAGFHHVGMYFARLTCRPPPRNTGQAQLIRYKPDTHYLIGQHLFNTYAAGKWLWPQKNF